VTFFILYKSWVMIIFFHFRLGWISLLKHVCFCVSSVVTHFWIPTQKIKKYKKYISKKYSEEIKKKYEWEKDVGTPIKWLEIGWGGSKIQKLKFNSIFLTGESPVDKENSIWGRKVQNHMFMDSIKFYLRFNWIYGGFDYKKNWFLSQFRLLLEEVKVLGSNYNFEELIWSNQGLNCIIIEVWWSIRDLSETIQNQGPNRKGR